MEPPATDDVYLNWGASGVVPDGVVDAMDDVRERHRGSRRPYEVAEDVYADARDSVAELLGCRASEMSLTPNTSEAVLRVADALDWTSGDAVVTTVIEHPAGVLPWRALADRRGVEVRLAEAPDGRLDVDDVARKAEGASLVCLSSVSWLDGRRQPVADAVEAAHDAGALCLVDAAQSAGHHAFDVGVWNADFVASTGHKWLCGPWGAGFLYVSSDVFDRLKPLRVGYRGVDVDGARYDDARMFDVSTESPALYAGLAAACRWATADVERRERRVRTLASRLHGALGERAVREEAESGLVSFDADDPEAFVGRLLDAGFVVRSLPERPWVRVSVHASNTSEELDRFVDYVF